MIISRSCHMDEYFCLKGFILISLWTANSFGVVKNVFFICCVLNPFSLRAVLLFLKLSFCIWEIIWFWKCYRIINRKGLICYLPDISISHKWTISPPNTLPRRLTVRLVNTWDQTVQLSNTWTDLSTVFFPLVQSVDRSCPLSTAAVCCWVFSLQLLCTVLWMEGREQIHSLFVQAFLYLTPQYIEGPKCTYC